MLSVRWGCLRSDYALLMCNKVFQLCTLDLDVYQQAFFNVVSITLGNLQSWVTLCET